MTKWLCSLVENGKGYQVVRHDGMTVGRIYGKPGSWRFLPYFQRRPSRRNWPTANAAVKHYNIALVSDPTELDS